MKNRLLILLAALFLLGIDTATAQTPIVASTAAYATSLVASKGRGTLLTVMGYNSKASAQFIQIFDAAALPADAAVPIAIITAAASSNFSFAIGHDGIPMATGIVVCNSSTGPTKTIGSADIFITVTYR